jgi:hypothetical protein
MIHTWRIDGELLSPDGDELPESVKPELLAFLDTLAGKLRGLVKTVDYLLALNQCVSCPKAVSPVLRLARARRGRRAGECRLSPHLRVVAFSQPEERACRM